MMVTWLLLLSLAGCVVDETGYGDTDVPGNAGEDVVDDGSGDPPEGVRSDLLGFSAATALGAEPQPVTIFGRPGALDGEGAVEVQVLPDGAVVTGPAAGSTFAVRITAVAGAEVVVAQGGEEVGSLLLSGSLVSAPDAGEGDSDAASGGDSDTDAFDSPGLGVELASPSAGSIDVGEAAVGLSGPYLVINLGSGAVVEVPAGRASQPLAAASGDEVCFVADAAEGGLESCVVVP